MTNWDTQERGRNQENRFTTSYGEDDADADWDGKSCSDFHQLPGRGIEDVESLTMLHGMEMSDEYGEDES